MIPNRKKNWKKTRSLSEKSNDIKKTTTAAATTKDYKYKNCKCQEQSRKIDFKNGWILRNEIFNDTLILLQWKFT